MCLLVDIAILTTGDELLSEKLPDSNTVADWRNPLCLRLSAVLFAIGS